MANTKIDKRTVKKGQSKTKNEPKSSYLQKIRNFWKGSNDSAPTDNSDNMSKAEITRFCIGAVLFIVSCFIFLSLVSHLFTATEDSTWVEGDRAHNWMGTLGLATARFFIDQCWGVSSIFIPLFLIVASLRIMQVYKVRLWKWFLNCSILMIWSSAFSYFLLQPILDKFRSPISLGGGIGMTEVSDRKSVV